MVALGLRCSSLVLPLSSSLLLTLAADSAVNRPKEYKAGIWRNYAEDLIS